MSDPLSTLAFVTVGETSAAKPARRARTRDGETHLGLVRRARRMNRELAQAFPHVYCELDFTNPLELTVATILSAQSTDKRVNLTTPALFKRYRTRAGLRAGRPHRTRGAHPPHRVLPQQDQLADPARPGTGRAVRRPGAVDHGRARHAARRRPQDRQRDPRQRLRHSRHHRRHPLRPAGAALALDRPKRIR